MDLFDAMGTDAHGLPEIDASAPLAVRMRPVTLDEVVGQDHLLAAGSPLRRLVEQAQQPGGRVATSSVILWGPPGTGKTTLAYAVARSSGYAFAELSAVSTGVKDIRNVVTAARRRLATGGGETVLFIDEVHRFSKAQQDALLPSVENRWVILIAATTENPAFSVISPLLSRSLLLTLHALTDDGLRTVVDRALSDERGLGGTVSLAPAAAEQLIRLAAGDARKALTILEASAGAVLADRGAPGTEPVEIDADAVLRAIDVAAVRYDRAGDQHYDVISAFIKSMRGSDVDAALHYLARMVAAGEDPRFIARRIMIAAAEDVGMADPSALQTAVAAAQAVAMIGMPEARIILAEAVVHVASAPKSNAAYLAIDAALADIRAGRIGTVPVHLSNVHPGADAADSPDYRYAHDYPHAVVAQQYLPDDLAGARYYHPSDRGFERQLSERLRVVRRILGRDEAGGPAEGNGDASGHGPSSAAGDAGLADSGGQEH